MRLMRAELPAVGVMLRELFLIGSILLPTGAAMANTAVILPVDLATYAQVEPIAPGALQDPAPAPAPPAEPEEEKEWVSRFDLGLNGSSGNTENFGLFIRVSSKREVETMRTLLSAAYLLGYADGDKNENNAVISLRNDWLIPDSPWFFYLESRFEYDQFQDWEYRLGLHGGIGYQFIDTEPLKFAMRAGAGFSKEWKSPDQPFTPEGNIGADLIWKISERQNLEFHTDYYPAFNDIKNFRTWTTLDWSYLLDDKTNMSLNAGLRHQYQAQVASGFKRNDLTVIVALGFDF